MRGKKPYKKNSTEIDLLLENMPELEVLDEEEREAESIRQHRRKKKKSSNKEFAAVTYFFVALFLVMMGYIVYFNVIRSRDMINSPYNVRLDSMADRVIRGKIFDDDGNILAETIVNEDGTESRYYPYGALFGHVVGYDSYGKSGVESVENFNLLNSNVFFLEKITKEIQEKKNTGDNVVTTLNLAMQQAAYDALGNFKGAVVVSEAGTGKVLTMVSKPSYDPNKITEEWSRLTTDENSALLNRATQGAYAPGSVFKIVSTLEYLRENKNYNDYTYDCVGEISNDGTTIHCANEKAHGLEDLKLSFAYSCNASYANIGLGFDLKSYRNTAEDLLFNGKLPSILPYTQSRFQLTEDSQKSEIMMTAMGQGQTQVSPYHVNLITSAIANGGILMKPYLVNHIENYNGSIVEKNLPEKYKRLLSSEEAGVLKEFMIEVIRSGTGAALKNEEYSVAGKTGTAEYSSDKEKSHSWFTGFTNIDNPELVITVIVESADNSGMSAVSVAKKVLNAYYY